MVGLFAGSNPFESLGLESRSIKKLIEGAETHAQKSERTKHTQEFLTQGKTYFNKYCFHCHGKNGHGNGPASYYLNPRPRDYQPGIFKFHSTQTNSTPRDEDLYQTILKGIPGTTMPAWGSILPDEAIHSLVAYIKSFSSRFDQEIPDYPVKVGPEPAFDERSIQKGKELYNQMRCIRCHGENGEKSGPLGELYKDTWGHISWVYDLRKPELYKAGSSGQAIYKTLVSGIEGTPMNTYDYLNNWERWHLVHYLLTFIKNNQLDPDAKSSSLVARYIKGAISLNPDNILWKTIQPIHFKLNPLKSRSKPTSRISVQSIINATQIAFRLQWKDTSPDRLGSEPSPYLDETAIQFSLKEDNLLNSPFIGMGERHKPVYIWHWKADSHQEVVQSKSHVPSFPISLNPFKETAVEELNARGFGVLSVQPMENQQISGKGLWKQDQWTVVLIRDRITPSKNDVQFNASKTIVLAFAVWDGTSKDKSATKMITFWQTLILNQSIAP